METEVIYIDYARVLEMTGNDQANAQRLLSMFIEELKNTLLLIKAAYEQANTSEVGRLAHRINGAAGYFGAPGLRKLLMSLEASVKQQKYDAIGKLLPALYQEAEQVLTYAEKFLTA